MEEAGCILVASSMSDLEDKDAAALRAMPNSPATLQGGLASPLKTYSEKKHYALPNRPLNAIDL